MSHETVAENPWLSTKPSDSNLTIALHPLVLLTVSDHITRHRVREEAGPVVGALLGLQKGRETTIEHAFQCRSLTSPDGEIILDQSWFEERLQQYKDVHKIPALELVGWFTLCPETGPTAPLLPIHMQVMQYCNESALLLAFHPSTVSTDNAPNSNGKLPLTIYESAIESDQGKGDGAMQIDGEDNIAIRFRPLPYTIETDETEMIAVDYVAKGAGSAAAVGAGDEGTSSNETKETTEGKGKKRADDIGAGQVANGADEAVNPLSTEEEDQIAGITTRLNSVRMLQSRLSLLESFIRSQPPSYLTDQNTPLSRTSPDPSQLQHLRNIQALLTRLSLLTPVADVHSGATTSTAAKSLTSASVSQSNDVALSSLLSILGQDVQGMSELGRKFASVEQERLKKGKGKSGMGPGGFGREDDFDGRRVAIA